MRFFVVFLGSRKRAFLGLLPNEQPYAAEILSCSQVVRLLAVSLGEKIRDRRSTERAKVMRAEGALGKRREEKEGLNSLL